MKINAIDIGLVIMIIVTALWAVTTPRLLRAAIGLIAVSGLLSVVLYRFDSPYAAVFELSVCAGLISVIFISTITLTQRFTEDSHHDTQKDVLRRYWFLPVMLIILALLMSRADILIDVLPFTAAAAGDVRNVLWQERQLDLVGQIAILLSGALGVVMLFKERKND